VTRTAGLPARSCLTETFGWLHGGGALIAVLRRTLEGVCGRPGWLEIAGSARGLRPMSAVRVRDWSRLLRLGGWVLLLRSSLGLLNCARPRAIPGPRVAQRSVRGGETRRTLLKSLLM
jgi:hypothetical protein